MITQENIPYTADEIKTMVKTCEKYNKTLEKAEQIYNSDFKPDEAAVLSKYLPMIFPELKMSEEERIKKALIKILNEIVINTNYKELGIDYNIRDMIAWLEKQGDKDKLIRELGEYKVKYTQKVLQEDLNKNTESQSQPKFKVRDWIVDDKTPNDVFYVIEVLEEIYKVIDIDGDDYHIPHCKGQQELLFQKIKDTGYEWDANKKELKKIEVKALDANEDFGL